MKYQFPCNWFPKYYSLKVQYSLSFQTALIYVLRKYQHDLGKDAVSCYRTDLNLHADMCLHLRCSHLSDNVTSLIHPHLLQMCQPNMSAIEYFCQIKNTLREFATLFTIKSVKRLCSMLLDVGKTLWAFILLGGVSQCCTAGSFAF